MRKKVVVCLVLLVVLLSGSFIFPGRFLHSASAESRLQPMDVGSLPPLLKVSKLQGADLSTRTLHLSIGLALRNQDQLSALLQSLYNPRAGSNCPTAGQSGGSQVAYIPSQFATAYNYDGLHSSGLQGQGQTVGVFELDGYSLSDVQTYTQCFGGGNVPIQNVILDGFNGQPGAGAVEVELDMEVILGQAPNLAKLIVYEAPNTTQGYNDEFARIVKDRTPVISVSWGDCEKNMGQQEVNQENQFFQQAAAQGQTILVAAGDSGSASCFQLQGGGFDTSLNADDPAAQPFVSGVAGTNLTLKSDNSYQSETVLYCWCFRWLVDSRWYFGGGANVGCYGCPC